MDPVKQLARVPARPPASDLVIAGALSAWATLEAFFVEGPGSPGMRLLAGLAMTLPLVLRRRYAPAVVFVVAGVLLLRGVLGSENENAGSFFPALLLATFSVALYARRAQTAVAGGVFAIAATETAFALGFARDHGADDSIANYVIIGVFVVAAWAAGWTLRRRVLHVVRVEAESAKVARNAVAGERARIARELHDIVAHSVSIISLQAGAAEQYLERDPVQAREHLKAVQDSAHDALGEMRRLTGVLREEPAGYDPQPGLGRVAELVDQARIGGLDVEFAEHGVRRNISPGVDLAAYRIVQEALTNARKHAGPVGTMVNVRYSDAEVEVEVINGRGTSRNGEGAGHGLVGMRERVRIYGGTLETGHRDDGGFRVRALLPLEAGR